MYKGFVISKENPLAPTVGQMFGVGMLIGKCVAIWDYSFVNSDFAIFVMEVDEIATEPEYLDTPANVEFRFLEQCTASK